jgi:hypothetical protein
MTWKNHVHTDGFYFRGHGSSGWIGIFDLDHCDDVRITRCLLNDVGGGYTPRFASAQHSARLQVRNCVISGGFDGFVVRGCPELTLENNVFLRNWIQQVYVDNNPLQKVVFRRNIVTDSLPGKVRVPLMEFARVESLTEEDNVYFLRVPDEERKPFVFYGNFEYERSMQGNHIPVVYPAPPLIAELTRLSLAEYRERFAPDSGSRVMNPRFRALEGEDLAGDVFPPDRLGVKRDLEFSDLFATDPLVVERGIGLQPEAFAGFHFNQPAAE